MQPSRVISASSVKGSNVWNYTGEKLGNIDDVMFDMESGRITYALLSFGGFLGFGDKLFAVPWAALEPNPDEKSFNLNVAKETLEDAPGFDKDNWPDMS